MKRLLILTHRWLGVLLCLWFAALFFSGGVMIYVPFPTLTATERILGMAAVDLEGCRFNAAQAWESLGSSGHPTRVRLAMREGRPAWYFFHGQTGSWSVVFADDGRPAGKPSENAAVFEATRFAQEGGRTDSGWLGARHDGLIDRDQWTVYSGNNSFRPLHRIRLGDEKDTVLYVSAVTGEVIRDTTRSERGWNWIGAVLHWLYWTPLRQNGPLWRTVVITASLFGCLLVVTGFVTGLVRATWGGKEIGWVKVPYRTGWMRLHFWMGAVFGVVTGTWILSGFVSMNAWGMFREASISQAERELYQGGPLRLAAALPVSDGRQFKEYELVQINGRPGWVATRTADETFLLPCCRPMGQTDISTISLTESEIIEGVAAFMKGLKPESVQTLETGDAYHYQRRESAAPFRPRVLKLNYADGEKTTVYVDPVTGGLLRRHTQASRLYRWLYHGLHSFDFPPLWPRRTLWDGVVLTLLSGGFGLSLTGVVLGLRRIRNKL